MPDDGAQKAELRRAMKAARAACTDRYDRDGALLENFFSLSFKGAHSFFLYNASGSEAATGGIAARLLAEGKEVYFPRVEGKTMAPVRYTGQALRRGAFGIGEPSGEPYGGTPDVCVLPLLAADGEFFRLGHGGGYYDRYLSGKEIYKVGLGYDFQLVGNVPHEPHDVRLDALVTDKRILIRR